MFQLNARYYPLLILALGLVFYLPFLGRVHLFDWDEVNFAESAREMLVTGNYTRVQIDYKPFWEKPPLFFWLQATAMRLLGVGEYAARLPNALMGVTTLLTLYYVGRRLHDARFGLLWALAYLGSITPHLYFKTGIIDPTFNFFIFLGGCFLAEAVHAYVQPAVARRNVVASGVFIGLAVLTKGPVGALLPALTGLGYWALAGFRPVLRFGHGLLLAGVAALVASAWFGLEVAQHGIWFLEAFVRYQIRLFSTPDAGHAQPFYYHFVVVLLGCFPISVLAIRYLLPHRLAPTAPFDAQFRQWMGLLFWVVMILFSIVKTKIVHYSSMAWLPVSYLATYHLYQLLTGRVAWQRATQFGLLLIGGLLGLALTALPLVGMNVTALLPYINDPFARANLEAEANWQGWEWLIGAAYTVAIVWFIGQLPKRRWGHVVGLFLSTAVCLWFYLAAVVPNIERYVQGAVIDFYESKQGQRVYARPLAYKSYAQLFYFRKPPTTDPRADDENFLLNGPVDRPVFFVCRTFNAAPYRTHPNLRVLKEQNGFVFFERVRSGQTDSTSAPPSQSR